MLFPWFSEHIVKLITSHSNLKQDEDEDEDDDDRREYFKVTNKNIFSLIVILGCKVVIINLVLMEKCKRS